MTARPIKAARPLALLLAAALLWTGGGALTAAQAAPAGLSAQAGAGLYDEFMRVCVAAQGDRAKVAKAASAPGWKEISMDELPADARGELDQLQDARIYGLDYNNGDDWKLIVFDGIMLSRGRAIGPMCMVLGDTDAVSIARVDDWKGEQDPVLEDKGLKGYLFYDVDGKKVPFTDPGARLQAGERKAQMLIVGGDAEFTVIGFVVLDR